MDNRFTLNRSQAFALTKILNTNVVKTGRLVSGILLVHLFSWMFLAFAIRSLWDIGHRNADAIIMLLPATFYLLIASSIYLGGMAYMKRSYARAAFADNGWILSDQILVATEDGITIKAHFGSVNLIWSRLVKVIQDNEHYYLLIEPCQGFMIPKRAVEDAALQAKLAAIASIAKS